MKKIILLLILSFKVYAQKPAENKAVHTNTPAATAAIDKTKQKARERIESYRRRVISGENMATLARLYSEDPGSKQEGGMYRNVTRGTMDPAFEAVAFSLKPGEISKVFETAYGFHFIQLIAKHGAAIDLRHILVEIN